MTNAASAAAAYDGTYSVPELAGVHGRVRLVGPVASRDLVLDDGQVTITPEQGSADCTITCFEPFDLVRLLSGELNLVTAVLQGRAEAEGKRMLAFEIAGSMPEVARHSAEANRP